MTIRQGHIARLRNYVDEFAEVLDQQEFLADELDCDENSKQTIINLLKTTGAIEANGRVGHTNRSKTIKWRWKNYREELQEYLEQRDTLPCNCRVHIPPERDGDTYYCKFCGSPHSRKTVNEAL